MEPYLQAEIKRKPGEIPNTMQICGSVVMAISHAISSLFCLTHCRPAGNGSAGKRDGENLGCRDKNSMTKDEIPVCFVLSQGIQLTTLTTSLIDFFFLVCFPMKY